MTRSRTGTFTLRRTLFILGFAVSVQIFGLPASASAQDWLCDVGEQDCREPLLDLIRNETVGIDVAFWFMEDPRYPYELARKHAQGVKVRVLMDLKANGDYPLNATRLAELKNAGIPMRQRVASNILHWKMMLFHSQNVVEFSGANFSSDGFRPEVPYADYVDEVIYFATKTSVVNSFKTKYDDLWTDTTSGRYADYANMTGPPTRAHAIYPLDPELNFVPAENFRTRSVAAYNNETQRIDAQIFRITDANQTNAIIAAVNRGVTVRLISEPQQYRAPIRQWHSWNIDRLYMAGVQLRNRKHQGTMHQKATVLHGQQLTIFGSSNWTSPSASGQEEHNYFTKRQDFYNWFSNQFERKWNNLTGIEETAPFVPLPPDAPVYKSPAKAATGQSTTSVTLVWDPGYFAHLYDIYFGTTTNPPLVASNLPLGPRETSLDMNEYVVTDLQPGTTYYWRVVSKTMALKGAAGPLWEFTTAGSAPPPPPPPGPGVGDPGDGDIILHPGAAATVAGAWQKVSDPSAAAGARVWHPDAGAAKVATALASPANYFQMTFTPQSGVGYQLWMRLKAQNDHYSNDSVHIQFSGSVTQSGSPAFRIGTTAAAVINLEDCGDGTCPRVSGWGWQDTGYGTGVFGQPIYFAGGTQTIRVQTREDGVSIDQILLSPVKFRSLAPGALTDDNTVYPATGSPAPPPPPPPPPPSETLLLSDDFNDDSIASAKWIVGSLFTGSSNDSIPVDEVSQRLVVGPLLTNVTGYYGVRSTGTFGFSNGYVHVQLAGRPPTSGRGHAMFAVGVSNYFYRWYVEGPTLYAEKRTGTKTALANLPYDASQHQFLRIRHEASTGRAIYETAPSISGAPGTWTVRYAEPWDPAIPLTNVMFELKGGTSYLEASPGSAVWDNFKAARLP